MLPRFCVFELASLEASAALVAVGVGSETGGLGFVAAGSAFFAGACGVAAADDLVSVARALFTGSDFLTLDVAGAVSVLRAFEPVEVVALAAAGFFGSLAFRSIVVGFAVSFASAFPAVVGDAAVFALSFADVLLFAGAPPGLLDFCAPVFGAGRCGGFTMPVFPLCATDQKSALDPLGLFFSL